jgi:pyruvate dehydrogenase E1 component alpha subunit
MGLKKKNKRAIVAKTRKGKSSPSKSRSTARRAPAKKKKPEAAVLPVLDANKLKDLYATMAKCRMLAERMPQLQVSGLGHGHAVSGLEAMLVGAGAHLLPQDCVASEHGSFLASLIKGTPLDLILARNREERVSNGAARSASATPKDGSAFTMDTVLRLAEELKTTRAVMLMFCTQNSNTLIFQAEAMASAATRKLPLVCLVESSFDSRMELPSHASGPYVGADAAFYPRIPVDGCDVVGVFRVAQEAVRRAREGHGPAVIECLTSRATGEKRGEDQAATQYTAREPLSFMENYLRRRDLWSDEWSRAIMTRFSRDLELAIASANPGASLGAQFDNVYSTAADTLRPEAAQRQNVVSAT